MSAKNEELVERAKGLIEKSEQIPGIEPVEANGQVFRWLYNTRIFNITNLTSSTIRIRNPERAMIGDLSPGAVASVNWQAPWVDNPTELYNKAITVRSIPSGASSSNPGTVLFRVFLDYDIEIVSWVPSGADYGMRNPIELTPGGGEFLERVSAIDLNIAVTTTPSVIVPGAVVIPHYIVH